jgi:serine protease
MRWAAGLPVAGAPLNPTPARIINLSLGGVDECSTAYQSAIDELLVRGVLLVASVGNDGGPIEAPANCPGVVSVTGLRHMGTKVGFSNLGLQATLGAPAGNCVNSGAGQPCLFSIIVATNSGTTVPGEHRYSDAITANYGTSFSAPQVAAAAALMLTAHEQLSTPQLIERLQQAATPFPLNPNVSDCHVPVNAEDLQTAECNCTTQTCGIGMLNTHAAVLEAQRPTASINAPGSLTAGMAIALDGLGSSAASGRTLSTYQWNISHVVGSTPTLSNSSQASTQLLSAADSQFTLSLTTTDDRGAQDTAELAMVFTAARKSSGGGGSWDWSMAALLALLYAGQRSSATRAGCAITAWSVSRRDRADTR